MGGERGGDEASRMAVERVRERLTAQTRPREGRPRSSKEVGEILRRTIRATSDEIYQKGAADFAIRGLGSTLVTVAFLAHEVVIAHVGDSRCYRVRQGKIERLTEDHTWVAGQVEAGTLTDAQARQHPQRSLLTRTLGDAVSPGVDLRFEDLQDGDLFLLCSDGLTSALTDAEVETITKRFRYAQDLAEALVALANDRDGSDNITVAVCRCHDRLSDVEPDDTEPILGFESSRSSRPKRSRLILGIFILLLLAASFFGPRLLAIRAYERGVDYASKRQYLHARLELSKAIRLGLDHRRAERLIDLLLRFPSNQREAQAPEESSLPEDIADR